MTSENTPPYRVADRDGEGWLLSGPDDIYTTYPRTDLPDMPYEQLRTERGPLRPVDAMEQEDSDLLAQAIAKAGKKGVITLLVALHRTARNLIDDGASLAVLTSGRPGSWEAAALRSVVWLGEDIAVSRVDPVARATAEELLDKWTTGPVQVELADGLASILGSAAKTAGGWDKITDRWIRGNDLVEHWTAAYRRREL